MELHPHPTQHQKDADQHGGFQCIVCMAPFKGRGWNRHFTPTSRSQVLGNCCSLWEVQQSSEHGSRQRCDGDSFLGDTATGPRG